MLHAFNICSSASRKVVKCVHAAAKLHVNLSQNLSDSCRPATLNIGFEIALEEVRMA